MAWFNCLAMLLGKKKRSKDLPKAVDIAKRRGNGNQNTKKQDLVKPSVEDARKENHFNDSSICALQRDFSDLDLQAREGENVLESGSEKNEEITEEITPEVMIRNDHLSDPELGRTMKSKSHLRMTLLKKHSSSQVNLHKPRTLKSKSLESVHKDGSPTDRVNAWVNSLEAIGPSGVVDDDDDEHDEDREINSIVFPSSLEVGETSGKNHSNAGHRFVEEDFQANNIIRSLNSFSSVAHICGMGLKVIPSISAFSSLRSVNLSGNVIVHIAPGSLPKSLHKLDLSRNKITTIEGLRELTRLRILNLSYNQISGLGHGFSHCTLIKELYLAGNKISNVEGLHRLLKLTVLDLSFNKITTVKALGQLVANNNSLLALNLLGNPIQNIGDDQLQKAVTSLLPQLAYLNKQAIKPKRVRATEGWSSRRRLMKRQNQVPGPPASVRDGFHRGMGSGSVGGLKISRHRSKSGYKNSSPARK